jgi:signal transduction histidine kinase
MRVPLPFLKPIALLVVLVMGAVAAAGFQSIRRDIESLQIISRDNILWSATQMQIELLRFQRSLALYAVEPSPADLDDVHERFEILLSRFKLARSGRVGSLLRQYDEGQGTLDEIMQYLEHIDPVIMNLGASTDMQAVQSILGEMDEIQSAMRNYSLRVVRGDTAAASEVRERMRLSSVLTAWIALGAVVICLLALVLIGREGRRQREMAAINLRLAQEAEAATRAKSRFLTMMSHELRNPLNGVLGPLALVGQTEIGEPQKRLIERAQQSGRIMSRMLRALLEYGDIQDDRLELERETFKLRALAREVEAVLKDAAAHCDIDPKVSVSADATDIMRGDFDRFSQLLAYLGECVLATEGTDALVMEISSDEGGIVAEIAVPEGTETTRWTVAFLAGQTGRSAMSFPTESLAPQLARGLLRATGAVLSLFEREGRTLLRVLIPAEHVVFEMIRVHVETRSAALDTLYRAALQSERVVFVDDRTAESADIVLVDCTSVTSIAAMQMLRRRFPRALFMSLGQPASPTLFDEVVDTPTDMARLRTQVLARLAS